MGIVMCNTFYQELLRDERKEENLQKALQYKSYIYEDARSYRDAMNREDYNKAVADAEQVAEKSLKAILQKKGKMSNTMKSGKHGHDIVYLSKASGISIKIPDKDLKQLSCGYFDARYPERNKMYSADEAKMCGKIAFEFMDIMIEELDISDIELDKEIGGKSKKENVDDLKTWNRLMD